MNPILTKNFTTGGAVTKRRLVKFSADATVVQAAAATDLIIGAVAELDAESGGRCDVHVMGIADVESGGTISRGALVTADSNGKAVAASPAAGVNNRVAGIAMVAASSGDIFPVLLMPHQIQGA
jgi:hypothetical protein